MIVTVNNNRPAHKNPKKSKAERMILREQARQAQINMECRLAAQRERDLKLAAALPAIRNAREISELERELQSYAGFSAMTRRRLKSRIATIKTRIMKLKSAGYVERAVGMEG